MRDWQTDRQSDRQSDRQRDRGDDEVVDRTGLRLELADDFDDAQLDGSRWLAHYLPHWTTPERSAARCSTGPDGLTLRIDADQPSWRDEDGPMRVSNLQTGSFSGPAGSERGQHRHRPGLTVVTPQPTRRLWTPSSGLVEVTAAASPDPTCMLAVWLVGLEDASPQDAGEICVAELFGNAIGPEASQVRLGVKAHHDPRLRTEMVDLVLAMDATQEHTYAAVWGPDGVRFLVDDVPVHRVDQVLDYPLQLMIDLFEFPEGDERDPSRYPRTSRVTRVRGYGPDPAG